MVRTIRLSIWHIDGLSGVSASVEAFSGSEQFRMCASRLLAIHHNLPTLTPLVGPFPLTFGRVGCLYGPSSISTIHAWLVIVLQD